MRVRPPALDRRDLQCAPERDASTARCQLECDRMTARRAVELQPRSSPAPSRRAGGCGTPRAGGRPSPSRLGRSVQRPRRRGRAAARARPAATARRRRTGREPGRPAEDHGPEPAEPAVGHQLRCASVRAACADLDEPWCKRQAPDDQLVRAAQAVADLDLVGREHRLHVGRRSPSSRPRPASRHHRGAARPPRRSPPGRPRTWSGTTIPGRRGRRARSRRAASRRTPAAVPGTRARPPVRPGRSRR